MASLMKLLFFLFIRWLLIASAYQIPQQYVVYMGGASKGSEVDQIKIAESEHLQLLSSVVPSHEKERVSLIHHYHHAFHGFSAMLTPSEASLLSGKDGVVSVFLDPILQLHTTRSWDFLEAESGLLYGNKYPSVSSDVIIGIIDTGIWPESPSFNDKGIGEIPSRWKGACMEASDFNKSNCNRKLIGARYYTTNQPTRNNNKTHHDEEAKTSGSPRDYVGHGTHTTSIAAGARVSNASYHGLAIGTARGGSPSTRIAVYKACTPDGCSGSTILKAIDDAIKDGVDIISISIGMNSFFESDYINDPIAIGAFHAEEMGVLVICSAGNEGPDPSTLVNTAPWVTTVAASNIDRDFRSTLVLGNGNTFQGSAVSLSNLTRSRTYPLVFGEKGAAEFAPISEARNCYPGSLDRRKVKGKIVVCLDDEMSSARTTKKLVAEDAGAKGLILISKEDKGVPLDSGDFPFTEISNLAGIQLLTYINCTKKPTGTILSTVEVSHYRPAPAVAYFSSRGPASLTENILKPDIMAPGVAILAAMIPERDASNAKKPSKYAIKSGTSMACPHVAGAAAFIKSVHHGWTSSMIKSSLMTTAIIHNNMGKPLTNSHHLANPHDMGVGEINPLKALDPGLVFQTTTQDYLHFLCYYGYPEKVIRSISKTKFSCPKNHLEELISNMNYPSISICKLDRGSRAVQTVRRVATNVGSPNTTYMAKVHAPLGLVVKVEPKKMSFVDGVSKNSFKVSFHGNEAHKGYNYGDITWVDGLHSVRVTFAVNVE